jgi:GAF domain-containing protein
VGTELAGFIGFDNVSRAGQWTKEDLALLRVSSKIIGDALRHKQLEDQIRNQAQVLETKVHERTKEIERLNATITERLIQKIGQISHISEVREKLKASSRIEDSLEVILQGAMEDLGLDVATVFLVDKENEKVEVKALKSNTKMNLPKTYRLDRPFVEYECMDANTCVSITVENKSSILGTKSVHCAPIMFGNEMMGFLAAGSFDENRLDESDLSVLKLYSGLVSTVFETANLAIEPTRETEMRKGSYEIASGSSLMVEDDIDLAYDIFVDRVMSGMEGLMVTRIFPKKIREKYGLEKTPIVWLNDEKIEGQITINNVQDLSIAISNFVAKAQKPAILIDGIEYLISRSGFDSVYRFLQTKRSQIESTDSILILPLFKDALDSKEAKLVQREFRLFKHK